MISYNCENIQKVLLGHELVTDYMNFGFCLYCIKYFDLEFSKHVLLLKYFFLLFILSDISEIVAWNIGN